MIIIGDDMDEQLTFEQYQNDAIQTLMYPGSKELLGLLYTVLGLNGEAGELAEKLKKILRDKGGELSEEDRAEVAKELGDVLWYVTGICYELDIPLEEVARMNIDKLNSRKERGMLGGSGDNR